MPGALQLNLRQPSHFLHRSASDSIPEGGVDLKPLAEVAYQWYLLLSQVSVIVTGPLRDALGSQSIPGLSALILGLMGGLAPCQLSGNAGAITYVTQTKDHPRGLWRTVWSFLGGKILVYLAFAFLAAILGLRIPIPFMALMRKLSGPLMILISLYLVRVINWRFEVGTRLTQWLTERIPRRGSPALWLGIAFSLGFCPTMATIFFGALVPLVINSKAGLLLIPIFGLGTAVPLLIWALALSVGRHVSARWIRQVRSADRYLRWGAAAVFFLLGLTDTLIYWFI